jgi:hypothetical protein
MSNSDKRRQATKVVFAAQSRFHAFGLVTPRTESGVQADSPPSRCATAGNRWWGLVLSSAVLGPISAGGLAAVADRPDAGRSPAARLVL